MSNKARYKAAVVALLHLNIFSSFASDDEVNHLPQLSEPRKLLRPEDFIVVINTDQERLTLALASRPLRVGIRTFIAIDNSSLIESLNRNGASYNETYAYFPNRNVRGPETDKPGDTRWQAAPFMAHHHFGPTYKWLLLGDDDTLWFMTGVQRLLQGYNHSLPYAISDHLGDHNPRGFFVPSPLAAVCSPCHWPQLLQSAGQERLMNRSSPLVSKQEAAGWDPKDLDGWGIGKMPFPRIRPMGVDGQPIGSKGGPLRGRSDGPGGGGGSARGGGGPLADVGGGDEWSTSGGAGKAEGAGQKGHRNQHRRRRRGGPRGEHHGGGTASGGGGGAAGRSGARVLLRAPKPSSRRKAVGGAAAAQRQAGSDSEEALQQQQQLLLGPGVWAHVHRQRHRLSQANMTALLQMSYYGPSFVDDQGAAVDPGGGGDAAEVPDPGIISEPIPPPGCPCRAAEACLHRARLCRGQVVQQGLCSRSLVFKIDFRGNRSWCRHSWAHGGAGVVLSVGLMQAVAGGPVETCARTTHVHSCDMNLAMCLRRPLAGGSDEAEPLGQGGGEGSGGDGPADAGPGKPATDLSGGGTTVAEAAGGETGGGSAGGAGGYMFTHPSYGALHGANWADPRYMVFDNPVYQALLHDPVAFLDGRLACGRKARAEALATAAAYAFGSRLRGDTDAVAVGTADTVQGSGLAAGEDGAAVGGAAGAEAAAQVRRSAGRDTAERRRRAHAESRRLLAGVTDIGVATATAALRDDEDRRICEWLMGHAVSLHIHRRRYESSAAAAAAMDGIARQHQKAEAALEALKGQQRA